MRFDNENGIELGEDFREDIIPDEEAVTEEHEDAEDPEEDGGSYYVAFRKSFVFEGEKYEGVDLSGLEDLSAVDLMKVNKSLSKPGEIKMLPELELENAFGYCARATGLPEAFFMALPAREAVRVKNTVQRFFYGEG